MANNQQPRNNETDLKLVEDDEFVQLSATGIKDDGKMEEEDDAFSQPQSVPPATKIGGRNYKYYTIFGFIALILIIFACLFVIDKLHSKKNYFYFTLINALDREERLYRKMNKLEEELKEQIKKYKDLEEQRSKDLSKLEKLKELQQLSNNACRGPQINQKSSKIELVIRDCIKLFAEPNFYVESTSIELFSFTWKLVARSRFNEWRNGHLSLYLHAIPPYNYAGPYSLEVDVIFRILNKLSHNDAQKTRIYQFDDSHFTGWGLLQFAKFETLLDPEKGFITEDGKIYVEVEFKVKSTTMWNHMPDDEED